MYITADTVLPERIAYEMQPYTYNAIVGELRLDWYNGYPCLQGKILEGTETARLLGSYSTKSIAGQSVTIYGVKEYELEQGRIVRVAM